MTENIINRLTNNLHIHIISILCRRNEECPLPKLQRDYSCRLSKSAFSTRGFHCYHHPVDLNGSNESMGIKDPCWLTVGKS